MPIYEYVCTACDHRTDILHGINDPGPVFCPSCGGEGTMRKLFAPPTIHYKGSGWAKKDRGGSGAGSSRSSRSSAASSTTGEGGGSSPGGGEGSSGSGGSSASGSPESSGSSSSGSGD